MLDVLVGMRAVRLAGRLGTFKAGTVTRTFDEGLRELSERVGHGDLVGHVVVDQIYAHYQHERLDLHHPRGGMAKYLEVPLYEHRDEYFEEMARQAFEEGGLHRAMRDAVEDLAGIGGVEGHAPFLWGDLHHSGHPSVTDNDEVVYERPPQVHRLTEEELREKARRTPLPPELLGWIWWHVEHHEHPPNYKGGA